MSLKAISTETLDLLDEYAESFIAFAEDNLHVRDHNTKEIKPFILNNPQRIMHTVVEMQQAKQGYVRIILDKARRFGGSTYIEGRGYWRTSMDFNVNTFIVGHEEDSVDTLFAMAKLFHEQNPRKPATKYSSKKELKFDNDTGTGLKSEYALACARDTSAGRSQGIHFLHGSEVAFWPGNPDELLDGLLSCISSPQGTEVYLESTGNGFGNRFQRDVFAAYCEGAHPYYSEDGVTYAWHNPKSDWVLIFIPWFAHEIYVRPFDNETAKEEFIRLVNTKVFRADLQGWTDSDEMELQRKYHLSLEQLHWRRWMIENTFHGRVEKFRQEFPATVEDSFLSSGSNVYPKDLCDMLEANCKPPILVGDIVERIGLPKIRPNLDGCFKMWSKPGEEATDTYVITVDSAGGKKERHNEQKREPDPSCIDVWHHHTGEQVAQWHGHIEYDMIADLVELIGMMYHRALACVEINNHGYTVVAGLKAKKYPMYQHHDNESGWQTTSKTKPQMVDGLYECARDGSLQIRCKETVSEMRTFVEKNGTYNAEVGCHDERVDTGGMASQMVKLLPRKLRETIGMRQAKPKHTGISNWVKKKPQSNYQEVYAR